MSESDEPEDRRTEGVRIIGAQEAAEAAARPDVVRRRTRREKRYGDRPDEPEAVSDLPKITISTTETEGSPDPDRFGTTIHPEGDADAAGPNWAEEPAAPTTDPNAGFGHARIVENDEPDEVVDEPLPEPEPEPEPAVSWSEPSDPAPSWSEQRDPAPSWSQEPGAGSWSDDLVGSHSASSDTWADSTYADEPAAEPDRERPVPEDATQPWSSEDFSDELLEADEPAPAPGHRVDEAYAALQGSAAGAAEEDEFVDTFPAGSDDVGDDDSFVLPHWTEPPTGQVPKVVVGEDAPEPESLATYGSQPRWRDERERGVVSDFDDLIDEGPRLGALGGDSGSVENDFFGDERYEEYDDLDDVDDYDDVDEEMDDAPPAAPRRRRGVGTRRPGGGDDHDGGGTHIGDRDLITAVGVGVGLVAVGLLCFVLGPLPTMILATAVVAVAAWEYFAAVRTSGYNPATLLGMASVIGVMVAAYTSGLAAYPVVLGLSVIAGLLWYLWVAPGDRAVQNLGLTLLGITWIGVLGSFATLFLGLGRVLEEGARGMTSNPGIGVLIAAVIAAVSHDVGAYFVGKYLGRTPLSAASPNKTQEGLVGGVLISLVVTVVVVGIVGLDPIGSDLAQTFVFALLCAIAAPLGDLAESFVKRDLDIKDMGSVLPGHGGVLDRFDALLFVLPVAYFVTVLFDIWSGAGA